MFVQMTFWIPFIIHIISTCTATGILYVLPDNVSDVNCPSQPCATLGQYLLDNGSLPVLSNVEYHFLPGEHHLVDVMFMFNVFNFSLIGFGLSSTKFVCQPKAYMQIFHSFNVTIKNLVFDQCSGDLFPVVAIRAAPSLFLYQCSHCRVENIIFFGYGFVGVNLFLNSYINNVTINITVLKPSVRMCNPKFFLWFLNAEGDHDHILINQLFITGYNDLCYESHKLMKIWLHKSYGINIELCNSQFYGSNQIALYIEMKYTTSTPLIVKNCTFKYIMHDGEVSLNSIIYCAIPVNNVVILFEKCTFYRNHLDIFRIEFTENFCRNLSNVVITNCDFIENNNTLMIGVNVLSNCKPNILLNGVINIAKNRGGPLLLLANIAFSINGTITVLENNMIVIMDLQFCVITFTKTITFISNVCDTVIDIISYDMQYIMIKDYANITFVNTTYRYLFTSEPQTTYVSVFPYCFFQYMAQPNNSSDIYELLSSFTITFITSIIKQTSTYIIHIWRYDIEDFLTHCKWLDKSLFSNYDPGYINQQIIQVNAHPWIHHKSICYCPYNGSYDCTVDLLGPVYPGQKLQVELCLPHAESDEDYVLHVETLSASLPSMACKLDHQAELANIISNYSKVFNFTVISDIEFCELFLIVQPFVRDAFYVQLLSCPVGFTLQNGKCNCDPLLPSDIDT